MNGKPEVFTAAHQYAARDWPVLPLKVDKSPLTPNGFYDATSDHDAVSALWKQTPAVRGVGIRTGAESRLVVLDIDSDKGGEESLATLEKGHGELPETVEVLTGGGGRHLYFKHPGGVVRCSAGKLGAGLDVRGDGGYVVAPPSPHPSGNDYAWREGRGPADIEIAEMPDWLAKLIEANESSPGTSLPTTQGSDVIPEGVRDETLTSLAGSLRRDGLSAAAIESALLTTNLERCKPPLQETEVAKIARSIGGKPAGVESGRVLEVVSARDLCLRPDPPISDLLVGPLVIRGNRTVIAADSGHGKTTFALQLAKAVTDGAGFLGYSGASDGRVLVIDAEQGVGTIKRRLYEADLSDSDRVDYVQAPDGLALDKDGPDVSQIEAMLARGFYDLLVADPLYKLHQGDSNEERQAVDLMRRLDRWRTDFDVGLLLLTHRRKSQFGSKGFTMDDIFGSSAFVRGAEVVLGLQRASPGYANLHFFKDRDGDLPVGEKWGLLFNREEGFRRDPEADKEKETARDRVRAALEEAPEGLTGTQLEKLAECSDKTVRKSTRSLDAKAKIGPSGVKTWYLPDDENGGDG